MSIDEIRNDIEILETKIQESEKCIEGNNGIVKGISEDIAKLLVTQQLEGTTEEIENEIIELRKSRQEIEGATMDLTEVIKILNNKLSDKTQDLALAEREYVTKQYNDLACKRKKLDEKIEKIADSLCEKFDELIELDKEQRNLAKIVEVGTGRHTNYVIEDYIAHKFRPYHRALGRVLYHLDLVETDSLNKVIEK